MKKIILISIALLIGVAVSAKNKPVKPDIPHVGAVASLYKVPKPYIRPPDQVSNANHSASLPVEWRLFRLILENMKPD